MLNITDVRHLYKVFYNFLWPYKISHTYLDDTHIKLYLIAMTIPNHIYVSGYTLLFTVVISDFKWPYPTLFAYLDCTCINL